MSLGAGLDAKEQVRQATDIVELVGSYVPLRRQGHGFVGLCPWHDDRRPSLQINPERQSFKCWVCDIGGDVFSFVMKVEGLEFREALELLAERAGIALQPARPEGGTAPGGVDKRTLQRIMAWAEGQFHRCLVDDPAAEAARVYLRERGISDESIRQFHLGYAADRWGWLVERLQGTEWTGAMLERAGLLVPRDAAGGYYDRFRGRLMFSIRDGHGRPIAFGGRILPQLADDRTAKYVNSPETPLFSKSRELYGLDVARDGIARTGEVVVMEGYTDCVMAHQHGLDNVVAVLGTALGERHLQLLRRYTDSITLVLDGDEAGRRRTHEIIDTLLALFVKNQVDLRILTLPENVDPCDCIASQGSDAFRQLLSTAVDALEHKFVSVTNGLAISTDTHRASQAVEQVLATLAQIRPDAHAASSVALVREQQMLSRIARQFHLPEEQLRDRMVSLRRAPRTAVSGQSSEAAAGQRTSLAGLPACDRLLLEMLIGNPDHLGRISAIVSPDEIESDATRRIFAASLRIEAADEVPDFARLMIEFDDAETKNLLVQLAEANDARPAQDAERLLQDLATSYERRRGQQARREALAAGRADDQQALAELERLRRDTHAQQLKALERKRK